MAALALGSIHPQVQSYEPLYVTTPVMAGQLFDRGTGELCSNYGFVTSYDRENGTETNVYFFPAIESKASDSNNYFVSTLKITVTGTKPDGSAISGLEFVDLAHLISPQPEGTEWDDALTFIYNVIRWIDPTGITELITLGRGEGGGIGWSAGTGYDANSAWAWYDAPAMPPATKERGLQFRFALHVDPDLFGTYTLNIRFYIKIKVGLHYPQLSREAEFTQTITYDYYYLRTRWLSISTSSGGTTDPAPGTYIYEYGSSVTVTATAYPSYTFKQWILDGATVYNNPIIVTMNSDRTLRAVFESPVGGIWVPVNKFALLAPYIGLASTIIVAIVVTVIYAKRFERRKEKQ